MEGTELSAVEHNLLDDYWLDHQYAIQNQLDMNPNFLRHYHIELDGRTSTRDDSILVSGFLRSSWQPATQPQPDMARVKVVVRLCLKDWYAVGQHSKSIRVLNCPVVGANEPPVLDATVGSAVVAAGVVLRHDESIRVAELFSGGFMGWGQSVSILQHNGVPVRLSWALDKDPQCGRAFLAQHDGATVVTAVSDMRVAIQSHSPTFLNADIQSDWWHPWLTVHPADVWCCSPPCQPWSTAGSQQGFHDGDGKLVLRLLSLIEIFQPELVCIEEVAGFRKHLHFPKFLDLCKRIGYVEGWSQIVDLIDFAPQSRKRCLIVLVRQDRAESLPNLPGRPVMPRRPTIGSFDCILQLQAELANNCNLAPETLAKYMDPYYCPMPRFANKTPDPAAVRIITAQGRFGTILAQYHNQHNLPEAALARGGTLGQLYKDQRGLRFLSGAECAILHCCRSPFFMPQQDSTLMTWVGNSLSTPQAIVPLALAVSSKQAPGDRVDPHLAVHWALQDRIRASQAVILPLRDGWVLCKQNQVAAVMSRLRPEVPWGQMPCQADFAMQLFWVKDEADIVPFIKSPGLALSHLLEALSIQYDEFALHDLQLLSVTEPPNIGLLDSPPPGAILDTPVLPEVRCSGLKINSRTGTGPDILVVLGTRAAYAVSTEGPTVIETLHKVAHLDGLPAEDGRALWQRADSVPLERFTDFAGTVVLVHDSIELPLSQPDCTAASIAGVSFLSCVDPARLFMPQESALQLGAGFPMQHLSAIGWFPRLAPAKHSSQPGISVLFQSQPGHLRLRQEDIGPFCVGVFFRGCLNSRFQITHCGGNKVLTKVQIEGRAVSCRGTRRSETSFTTGSRSASILAFLQQQG